MHMKDLRFFFVSFAINMFLLFSVTPLSDGVIPKIHFRNE